MAPNDLYFVLLKLWVESSLGMWTVLTDSPPRNIVSQKR